MEVGNQTPAVWWICRTVFHPPSGVDKYAPLIWYPTETLSLKQFCVCLGIIWYEYKEDDSNVHRMSGGSGVAEGGAGCIQSVAVPPWYMKIVLSGTKLGKNTKRTKRKRGRFLSIFSRLAKYFGFLWRDSFVLVPTLVLAKCIEILLPIYGACDSFFSVWIDLRQFCGFCATSKIAYEIRSPYQSPSSSLSYHTTNKHHSFQTNLAHNGFSKPKQ